MRNGIFFISVLSLFISCQKSSNDTNNNPDNIQLDEGLIAHYPFNGNANDESGNHYDLSVNGAVLSSNRFGESSKAYSFNGVSSYMTIPKLLKADSLREFTISLWVKTEALKNQHILSFFASPEVQFCNHFLGFVKVNGQFLLYDELVTAYDAWGCSMTNNYDTVDNVVGNWSHIVLVQRYNVENSGTKKYNYPYYLNGKKLKPAPTTGGSSLANPMAIKFSLDGLIGCSPGHLDFFSGSIDDVRIYNRALSEDEIIKLYNLPN